MFNKQNLPAFRKEINEALELIAKKHNVSMSIGNISFNSEEFTTKITCKTLAKLKASSEPLLKEYLGIKLGMKYPSAHGLLEVVDFKPSRPKNDVVLKSPAGKLFKASSLTVKLALGLFIKK
jgi:hypothetical protein